MKRYFPACLLLISFGAMAETTVTVEVVNVAREEGTMVLTVYDSKKSWLKRGTLQEIADVGTTGSVTFSIELAPGDYAFHAYQDLDGNNEMKTNFIGIPKEPTAVSNNAKGKFGPPKFKDAKIAVGDEPVVVSMNLTEID